MLPSIKNKPCYGRFRKFCQNEKYTRKIFHISNMCTLFASKCINGTTEFHAKERSGCSSGALHRFWRSLRFRNALWTLVSSPSPSSASSLSSLVRRGADRGGKNGEGKRRKSVRTFALVGSLRKRAVDIISFLHERLQEKHFAPRNASLWSIKGCGFRRFAEGWWNSWRLTKRPMSRRRRVARVAK